MNPKCKFLRLNRDWGYEANPFDFNKRENVRHLTHYLLLVVVNDGEQGNVCAPLEETDKERFLPGTEDAEVDGQRARGNIIFWTMQRLASLLQDNSVSPESLGPRGALRPHGTQCNSGLSLPAL